MQRRVIRLWHFAWVLCVLGGLGSVRADLELVALKSPVLGQRLEFRVDGVPAAMNPFDPDVIRVDAMFVLPSGRSVEVPAFWYQDYTHRLSGGNEVLTASDGPQWRLRFLPAEAGPFFVTLRVATNGQPMAATTSLQFVVPPPVEPLKHPGFARVSTNGTFFITGDGAPLPLVGANICWPGSRGTFDYDQWFPALATNGGNFARLWMAPWQFGIEAEPSSLNRYRLDRAWQLDRVFELAEERGIQLMLCLDYHGMFATDPDPAFGGNDNWKLNPYNAANGGPAANPNAFFTDPTARTVYQKRLRYLVARYGYSPQLLAWEFLNEIDNVYGNLQAVDVAAWHGVMGAWLKTNDPFGHLITTSLTGGSERAELWNLPQIDFTQYHSYGEPNPATTLAEVSQRLRTRYGKPTLVGEFGVDFRGWKRSADPYLRGFRQALWGGALGGSAGTAMSWWWENLYSENVYPQHRALREILGRTHWGDGGWTAVGFATSGLPPATVGDMISGGAPFNVTVTPAGVWAGKPRGTLAVPQPESAGNGATMLNSFVHGTGHPELKTPFKLNGWFGAGARAVAHVNSVSQGARLGFYVDGSLVLSTNLPDKDGRFDALANEYNVDIPIPVPAGKHTVEIRNLGGDWFYLDWVRLEAVLPSAYAGNWQPTPPAVGLRGEHETLLYVVSPLASFPAGATNANLTLQQGGTVTLTNWPAGDFVARWFNPANATPLGETTARTDDGNLVLPLPDFAEDVAGILLRVPVLREKGPRGDGVFRFEVDGPAGYPFVIERSPDLLGWGDWLAGTNTTPPAVVEDTMDQHTFYRVRIGTL